MRYRDSVNEFGEVIKVCADFDPIDKPQHYADKEIEVIDYIRDTLTQEQYEGYCIGNVLKYVSRYKKKGGVEDLKKAGYYLGAVIQEVE